MDIGNLLDVFDVCFIYHLHLNESWSVVVFATIFGISGSVSTATSVPGLF